MAEPLETILTKHQIYLQRLVPQLGEDYIAIIDSLNREFRGDLSEWLDNNEQWTLTVQQQRQVDVLANKIRATRGKAIDQALEKHEVDMFDLAEREQSWISNGVERIGGPTLVTSSVSALEKMVTRTPFAGSTIKQMYTKLSEDDSARIINTVQRGLSEGLTSNQIQREVFGTKRLNYIDGVLQTTRNSVNSSSNSGIVRTTVNGVNNQAKIDLYNANSDIVDKVKYSATLDGRTSLICASRSGNIYDLGKEPPLPAHINCRSYYLPFIEDVDIESTQPSVTDTRTRKEREKDFRAEARDRGVKISTVRKEWAKKNIKQVSTKTNFNDFLKQQDKFAKEYLGPTKYDLWKNGGLTLDKFVDPLGKQYTIDELYKKERNAFRKADVDKPK
jgi:SPP1 gp7 family putative phage head morphogenesis protein